MQCHFPQSVAKGLWNWSTSYNIQFNWVTSVTKKTYTLHAHNQENLPLWFETCLPRVRRSVNENRLADKLSLASEPGQEVTTRIRGSKASLDGVLCSLVRPLEHSNRLLYRTCTHGLFGLIICSWNDLSKLGSYFMRMRSEISNVTGLFFRSECWSWSCPHVNWLELFIATYFVTSNIVSHSQEVSKSGFTHVHVHCNL